MSSFQRLNVKLLKQCLIKYINEINGKNEMEFNYGLAKKAFFVYCLPILGRISTYRL